MYKFILTFFFLISTLSFSKESDILGKWITEKAKNGNQVIVTFYKKNNLFFGKIDRLTIPTYSEGKYKGKPKMDLQNPNPNLKEKPLVGIDFVKSFAYDESSDSFKNGFIYNPENGKTYYCSIKFKNPNTLIVKGSIDKSGLIGKKQIWKRAK